MNRKKKQCKSCGKHDFLFSKGRCKSCANIDYQKKYREKAMQKPPKQLKRTPISRVPTKRQIQAKDKERDAMRQKWSENQDINGCCYCEECGKNLGQEMQPYFMAHVLSKGADVARRADKDNIIILCMEHHDELDGGAKSEMKIFKKVETILQKMKMRTIRELQNIADNSNKM